MAYTKYSSFITMICLTLVITGMTGSCDYNEDTDIKNEKRSQEKEVHDEKYVLITDMADFVTISEQDISVFRAWGKQFNVETIIMEADEDTSGKKVFEQALDIDPDGILIRGGNTKYVKLVKIASAKGIPTAFYESKFMQEDKVTSLNSDKYEVGRKIGEELVKALGGKGKVLIIGALSTSLEQECQAGLNFELSHYSKIELLDHIDDQYSYQHAQTTSDDLLKKYDDIDAVCALNAYSGLAMAKAIEKANAEEKVHLINVDWSSKHIEYLKTGAIDLIISQKRNLFVWYGAQFLYNHNHMAGKEKFLKLTTNSTMLPKHLQTGYYLIDKSHL